MSRAKSRGRIVARCWVLVAPGTPGAPGVEGARFYVDCTGLGTPEPRRAAEFETLADARLWRRALGKLSPYRVYRRGHRVKP